MTIRIKIKNKPQLESKRSDCEKAKGWACQMYPVKDPPISAGKTSIEPPKIKRENTMINRLSSEEVIKRNEKEINEFINNEDSDSSVVEAIYDALGELESEKNGYVQAMSQLGFARKLITKCIEKAYSF